MHRTFSILLPTITALASCVSTAEKQSIEPPQVSWKTKVEEDQEDGSEDPRHWLSIIINGEEISLREDCSHGFRELDKVLWQRYAIPDDALIACHGWWAGYGETMYVLHRSPYVLIYQREIEEQVPVPDYTLMKKIRVD